MLEHEAFKGTRRVGTLDWQQEAPLLTAQDEGEVSQLLVETILAKMHKHTSLLAILAVPPTDCIRPSMNE